MPQVKDVMISAPGHVDLAMSLRDAAARMKSLHLDPILVVHDGKIAGQLAERDILALVARNGVGAGMKFVRDVMTADVVCCRQDQSVSEAMEAFHADPAGRSRDILPVVDEQGRLVGQVTRDALVGPSTSEDDGMVAVDKISSIDQVSDFSADPVQYTSDESFPASDPAPPPSTLGPDETN